MVRATGQAIDLQQMHFEWIVGVRIAWLLGSWREGGGYVNQDMK